MVSFEDVDLVDHCTVELQLVPLILPLWGSPPKSAMRMTGVAVVAAVWPAAAVVALAEAVAVALCIAVVLVTVVAVSGFAVPAVVAVVALFVGDHVAAVVIVAIVAAT